MANLAIRGHATRGKEVIDILKMLGGSGSSIEGKATSCAYFINDAGTINFTYVKRLPENYRTFTIEEFLGEFPYKVGDRVKIKETGKDVTIEGMSWRNGCEVIYDTCYNNDCVSFYSAEELQPYKEETMEIPEKLKPVIDLTEYSKDEHIIKLGNYEIKEVDGVVKAVRKQSQYPKTYEECCEVLGCKADDFFTDFSYDGCDVEISDYEDKIDDLLQNFRRLRYCRDAYWKMAGEQMGLGKPWEPDWENINATKYCIYYVGNKINKQPLLEIHRLLAFPTKEIRDAFYENFKDLIEQCKELL